MSIEVLLGQSKPVLSLRGNTTEDGTALASLTGFKVFVEEGSPPGGVLVDVEVEERFFNQPLPFEGGDPGMGFDLDALPDLVLEGHEEPEERFLFFFHVSGWKLELKSGSPQRLYKVTLGADLGFDVHPGWFPGSPAGEIVLQANYGDDNEDDFLFRIPWPFAAGSTLEIDRELLELSGSFQDFGEQVNDDHWQLKIANAENLLDSAGALLQDQITGFFAADLTATLLALPPNPDADECLTLKVVVELDVGAGLSLWGANLTADGQAAIALHATIREPLGNDARLDLEAWLRLKGDVNLEFTSPFARKLADVTQDIKEVVELVNIEGEEGTLEVPVFKLRYDLPLPDVFNDDYKILDVSFPLSWGGDPVPSLVRDAKDIIANLIKGIQPEFDYFENLIGKCFRACFSDEGPLVRVCIEDLEVVPVDVPGQDPTFRLEFEVSILVEVIKGVEESQMGFEGRWGFTFDPFSFAFIPDEQIQILVEGAEEGEPVTKTVFGVRFTFPDRILIDWGDKGLALTFYNVSASYKKGADPRDEGPGFLFAAPFFRISSGGVEFRLALTVGDMRLRGVGTRFKGARGEIAVSNSQVVNAVIAASGPVPFLDNRTASIELAFSNGLRLERIDVNFELGEAKASKYGLEFTLTEVEFELFRDPDDPDDFSAAVLLTGSLRITGSEDNFSLLNFFEGTEFSFVDWPITEDGIGLPAEFELYKSLTKPQSVPVLEVFDFTLKGLGIEPSSDPREVAFTIGGQLRFSAFDLDDVRIDFHKLEIKPPAPGEILPRVTLERLGVAIKKGPVEVEGVVGFFDSAERKGFLGGGRLIIGDGLAFDVMIEIARALRSDGRMVRVWVATAELGNIDVNLFSDFYLRDLGGGFGLRKTLGVLDNPAALLEEPGTSFQVHRLGDPDQWVDKLEDVEGSPAWTAALQAWMTLGLPSRNAPALLVGDLLLIVRSDMTFLFLLRAWAMQALNSVRSGDKSAHPIAVGLVYYSVPERHLLLAWVVDSRQAPPEGVPAPIVNAFLSPPFSFVLETAPSLFRLELGWPRELQFQVGIYKGILGLLIRKTSGSLTVGVGFEFGYFFNFSYSHKTGIVTFFFTVNGGVSAFGNILARVGTQPALFGTVGVHAFLDLSAGIKVRIKIPFDGRITLRYAVTFSFAAEAAVVFGVLGDGFGMEGYASVSVKIWKYRFSAKVDFAVNKQIVEEARARVTEGTTGRVAGVDDQPVLTRRELPWGIIQAPLLADSPFREPEWGILALKREGFVYVLALPRRGGFATPEFDEDAFPDEDHPPNPETDDRWKPQATGENDYEFLLNLDGANLLFGPELPLPGNEYIFQAEWNRADAELQAALGDLENIPTDFERNPVTEGEDIEETAPARLGDFFYEPSEVQEQIRILEQLLAEVRPDLLEDWRVRAESEFEAFEGIFNPRPDTRTPDLMPEGSLYDAALQVAMCRNEEEVLTSFKTAVSQTTWAEDFMRRHAEGSGLTEDELFFLEFIADIQPDEIPILQEDEDPTEEPEDGQNEVLKRLTFRERLLDGAEALLEKRAQNISKLIGAFQDWAIDGKHQAGAGNEDKPADAFLRLSGLAFKFEITEPASPDWSIEFEQIRLHRTSYDDLEVVDQGSISHNLINAQTVEDDLGFNQEEFRMREVREFQNGQGLHLVFDLHYEFAGRSFPYSKEEMADLIEAPAGIDNLNLPEFDDLTGMSLKDDPFEFFSHYRVARTNLSASEDQVVQKVFEARPVFVPTLVEDPDKVSDTGSPIPDQFKFYLLAPRFDFTDNFEERNEEGEIPGAPGAIPVQVGDRLLYRIEAVDVFGNTSRPITYYTVRKSFALPPPPERGRVTYTAELTPWEPGLPEGRGEVQENIDIVVTPHRNADSYENGPITYELWARSIPINTEGFYGQGNSALDPMKEKDEPVVNPKGMFLVKRVGGGDLSVSLTPDEIQGLPLGQVHEFYVRAVNPEGLASRLMRCEHQASINRVGVSDEERRPEHSQPNLERIPPVFDGMEGWLPNTALRGEAGAASEPFVDTERNLISVEGRNPEEREVTLRILHRNHLDLEKAHPTGGYEIFFRDRDETLGRNTGGNEQ